MPSTNNRQSKKEKAFTLIELLVVIAIVGILAGLAAVNMRGATEAARIAQAKSFSSSVRNSLLGNRLSEWRFDEGADNTAFDTIGSNNGDLTGHAPAWKTGTDCVSGSCLQFNGTSNYVDAGSSASLNMTDNFTVEFWAKASATNQMAYAIGTKNTSYVQGPGWLSYHSEYNGGTVDFIGKWTGSGTYYSRYTVALEVNKWHHYAFTLKNGALSFYYDSVLKTPGNVYNQGSLDVGSDNLWMGKRDNAAGGYAKGFMDEVRIYNAALTASAIREDYLAGLDKFLADNRITEEEHQQRLADLNLNYAVNE
jgi:prepilin-type N-terminal cleavage/methylation domain-containing protein